MSSETKEKIKGKDNKKLFSVWKNMKNRCNNKNYFAYHRYGGRGISYERNWESFDGFAKDVIKSYKEGLQLDRIDNNGNYCKENCRWVTSKENNNNRSNNVKFFFDNKSMSLLDWSKELGVNLSTLSQRIYTYKWELSKALTKK